MRNSLELESNEQVKGSTVEIIQRLLIGTRPKSGPLIEQPFNSRSTADQWRINGGSMAGFQTSGSPGFNAGVVQKPQIGLAPPIILRLHAFVNLQSRKGSLKRYTGHWKSTSRSLLLFISACSRS